MSVIYKGKKIDSQKLRSFGFTKQKTDYVYCTGIVDGRFTMTVTISDQGQLTTEVDDTVSGEEYILHRISDAAGSFVGRVRSEHDAVLAAIEKAFLGNGAFKFEITEEIISYAKEKYKSEPEFLWKQYPNIAVLRRCDNDKWYVALFRMPKDKLGFSEGGDIEIMDVRAETEEISAVVDGERYLPGYHMNKKHWLTVCLDGSVSADEILGRVDASYELAAKK